ncbi:Hsp70 protein-domain-containing protein [Lasiosphaeria miniovina]|uniref:Hsp70 protein-domain-containing protein n=1 Tax=Lasiosphaeria miniovina TaxID=1954250 RepID=A0AA39ZYP6_9PEZI|nr:Hsp70 protein-domain-containing protein [Lasiosphaeria miniovina]KAK0706049.1 Hsp70 protein-domain-containing protein [Lasiosphaeria miniovina]
MARPTLSALSIFLSAVLFSAHVFAVSAVLGVDLGTEYIKAALVKPGIPLEIVLTKDSRRKEISAVTFKPASNGPRSGAYPERVYGSDAMALVGRFPGDVYPNLKTLLGLPADHKAVKEYAARHPALQLEAHKLRNTAALKSAGAFTPEEEAWLVEELLAMELQSIRSNAEALAGAGSSVRSVVLTVPPFYTVEERRSVELAAELAGFKVLSLISDGLAVGLNYATSRQFPNINEGGKPEHHMVFDMGAGSTKATVLKFQSRTVKDIGKFNKTVQEVQVLGSGWDRSLGGDALNYLIVDDMVAKFVESPKAKKAAVAAESVKAHGRAIAKLTKEAERLRHVLSANQATQTSFEGLYDDVDFKYKITRGEFEDMVAAAYVSRVGAVAQNALDAASLQIKDLDSVILHGGASRTPFVQRELENILGGGEKIRTNVNSDEAAVFGAGFRAAEISPSFRVKEIRVSEAAVYPAGMKWKNDEGKPKHQRLWTAASHLGAPAKELTFSNHEDLSVNFYQLTSESVEADTKVLTTTNLTATVAELVEKFKCEKSDIRLKVSVRLATENGEVDVTKAAVECEADEPEKEGFVDGVKNLFGFGKKEQQPLKDDGAEAPEAGASTSSSSSSPSPSSSSTSETTSTSTSTSTTSSSSGSASESADAKSASKKKQLIVIPVKFTVEKSGIPQLPKADLLSIKDRLKSFEASDRSRRQREDALNQLEAYTYKIRDVVENEDFIAASTAAEREKLEKKTSETSDWLYGEGADATRDQLKKRLKDLQDIVNPVQKRIEEASKRPELVKDLKDALVKTKEFVDDIKKKIADHEEFVSSQAASSSSATSTSSESATTAAPSGDFDGLEDEEAAASTTKTLEMEDLEKERGPVPPLYTLDDLKESEDLYVSISTWLEEKVVAQDKLGVTQDPVLLIKDLTDKREKLDKAGIDLAMKGVRNFEKNKPKGAGGKKPKLSKEKTKPAKPAQTIKLSPGEDGKMPTQEEIDEMLKKFMKEHPEAAEQASKAQSADKEKDTGEETPRKHEEL